MKNPRPVAYLAMLLISFIWGNAFVAIKYALQYVTPVQLLVFRFIPAAFFFFLILVKIRGLRLPLRMPGRDRWRLALAALFGIPAYNLALNWGEQHITAGMASLIIALSPGLIFIFSLFMLGGATHIKRKALGLAISFAGLAFMVLRAERVGGGDPGLVWLGALATLGSPLSWALYTILGKPLVERYHSVQVTAWATLLGVIPILFLARPSIIQPALSAPPSFWLAVGWLVLFCTVFAFAVWYWALKRLGATETAVFIYLIPAFAILCGRLLLDEPITLSLIAGGAAILAGIYLVNYSPPGSAEGA